MAEEAVRSRQYEYKANSNLVLEADKGSRQIREDEGKGEVETLHGKLRGVRMGDKVTVKRSDDLDERIEAAKRKRNASNADGDTTSKKKKDIFAKNFLRGSSSLVSKDDIDSISYKPKTRESRLAYEEILSFVQVALGDQPQDVLRGATDEIISLLKDEVIRDSDRQKEINKILSFINAEKYNQLVNLGRMIIDYNKNGDTNLDDEDVTKLDEDMGVAVVFDDEDDDEGGDQAVEVDEGSDEEEGEEAFGSGTLVGSNKDDADGSTAEDKYSLSVNDIDAFWLQRQISRYYSDANISSKLAEDTLQALQLGDERSCENKLVLLLDFDKFDFIKLLLRNRAKIHYCTLFKQSQSDDERKAIEEAMMADALNGGPYILKQLHQKASAESWTQDRIGEFANKARREALALNKKDSAEKGLDDDDDDDDDIAKPEPTVKCGRDVSNEKIIDLDGLQFYQGGRLMTNDRCELPEKSWRAQKKGYEEVHVPAVRPIIPSSERLVEISDLPEWVQPAFPGIRSLNRVQSKMMKAALFGADNILLCAPTGAGKTNVALLCMLHTIGQHLREDGTVDLDAFKIVYVAPMKALVQECVLTFGKKLASFGIHVKELSGDQNLTRQQIKETQVIITTPEKWDIVTRKSGERTYTQLVKLMIIDEVHLLHDDRGPVLETLVARTIRQIESTQEMVRLVGLSATLPNYEDVATFLRVDPEKGLFFFDSSYRPVPLQQQYIGITEKKALKRFQLMNEICYEKVLQLAGKNQVLIFCHSRAETVKTAKALRDMAMENDTLHLFVENGSASKEILREEAEAAKNHNLKDVLPYGFAIHHAGLVRSDRTLVEDLFSDKHIQVLVSTATLAWGVNLPCHTVILKGTQMYDPEKGAWTELSPLDVMQMMGRAGRYGLDSEGEGIIITAHSELQYYLSLMNQQLPIESQFIKRLPDLLNAEIVLGSVSSIKEAAQWMGYTYLYIRMLKYPQLYGISDFEVEKDPTLLQRRLDLAHTAAMLLDKHNLIKYDRKSSTFQVTTLGRVASHYYVNHSTIHTFNEFMKPVMSDLEIFRLFSLSGEFKNVHVREEEKLELAKLVTRVPVPVKEGVEEPSAKINVLLQAYISRLKLDGFALISDMAYVQQSACRLMRALFEIAIKRGWSALACRTLNICKMVERRIWGSQSPLRQFASIPEAVVRKLEKNSDISWERFYDLKPQDLGEMVKIPKMGKSIHKYVHMFPKLELSTHVLPITRSLLKVDLTITPDFQYDISIHDFSQLFWIIVEDTDGEKILHYESFSLRMQHSAEEHTVSFAVPIHEPFPPQYFIKVVSDRWLHSQVVLPVSFRHLILPQKFPPPTELLDLQPMPIAALGDMRFEKLYRHIRNFNPIQTQTFTALYESDESIFVGAPTGSGKTICGEFAILRLLAAGKGTKCGYIAPIQDIADSAFKHWSQRMAQLGLSVVKLTGDTTTDLKLVESGNLIIGSAIHWDSISRRWKQRKHVQNISLYVVDEMHLLGGVHGPNLEVVVSRIRKIAAHLDRHIRIVALASSIANAKDIADWVGISPAFVYNFSPHVRPVPLEVHLQGFDMMHSASRLLAMTRPAYNAISAMPSGKPAIIFVSSRKQAQLTAIDIISYLAVSSNPDKFLGIATDDQALEAVLATIREPALAQTLSRGVGFLHAALSRGDKERVEGLYRDGVIRVLIMSYDLCWVVPAPCSLVVIMDTEYYEGKEHRFVEYTITDVMQMVGTCCRPSLDDTGKCIIYCHSPRKDYLKRLLNDPLPIESHLDHFLHDHLNAEIVAKTIESKENAVDYMTWTFYYRRLVQNPNYYSLQGTTYRHLSDHLSEIVETTITDLEQSKCISVEDDMDVSPLNLGMIAGYYCIQYTTVELFASSLTAKTKIKGLLEILSAASEYTSLAIRQSEPKQLEKFSKHLPQALPDGSKFEDPTTKAFVLLQSHFSRLGIPTDWAIDLKFVLTHASKILQALVDVISSQGWLKPALAAMELSQMVVQGLWDKDSVLLQIPHFTRETLARCKSIPSAPVETVYDLLDLDDDVRDAVLQMSPLQVSDVATFCNAYPNMELSYKTDFDKIEVGPGDSLSMTVTLAREVDDDDVEALASLGKAMCPRYPNEKTEGWWLVVGNASSNALLSIKKTAVGKSGTFKLEFAAPEEQGSHTLKLYFMSDTYLGCDQEYELVVNVNGGMEE